MTQLELGTETIQTALSLFKWFHRHPELALNEFETTKKIREVLESHRIDLLPNPEVTELDPSMGGEDFSCYQQIIPGTFFNVGVSCAHPVHNSKFKVDPEAFKTSIPLFVALVKAYFEGSASDGQTILS